MVHTGGELCASCYMEGSGITSCGRFYGSDRMWGSEVRVVWKVLRSY